MFGELWRGARSGAYLSVGLDNVIFAFVCPLPTVIVSHLFRSCRYRLVVEPVWLLLTAGG